MTPIDASQLTFKPLHPTFGAECFGVDFSQPLPSETVASILSSLAQYGVLVFRQAKLDDARHVAFAAQLGELDDSSPYIKAGRKHRLAPYTELFDVSNLDDDGNIVSTDSLRYQLGLGNSLFHVDSAFNPRRAGYSILRAHKLPPRGTGGATAFADTRTAYDELDADTKDHIQDFVLNHSLWHSRRLAAPDCEFLKGMHPGDHFMSRHRLVQLHERSGRTNLYIAHHAHHIEGLEVDEGQDIIRELLQHASQDRYTFKVEWENDGDIIIWDNTCVMHKVCRGTFEGKYIRDMRRATVHDSSSSAWGLNEQTDFRAGMP
ncbi:Clavaminate synthase-like protein [Lophiostoma macrostomum CBS 122681]|uniref:Clavaminate synthase-like protein n=1 Tax=Lophiostoma macrostomum CBS 122681 TaxID=1314788 RepID=A0A6A6SWR5_9PLEO|nr:Clavaminate synthase-like protein [Lophiostoma macrostomum CBS 122681]